MAAVTQDVKIIRHPLAGQRFNVKLLADVATTSDNNKWVGVAGARDMTVIVSGLASADNPQPSANSADIQIRVHNSRARPAQTDFGFPAYGATRDAAVYIAGPIEWIKADVTRVTLPANWHAAASIDVDVSGVY